MQSRVSFTITPHKVALCILIQDSCTPERVSITRPPSDFSEVKQLSTPGCEGLKPLRRRQSASTSPAPLPASNWNTQISALAPSLCRPIPESYPASAAYPSPTRGQMSASARPMLSIFLLEHVRKAQDYKEKTLAELCDALSALEPLGRGLASQLVHSLRKITSPDDLFDTLHALELLLLDNSTVDDEIPGLDPSSVLGVFLRKVRTRASPVLHASAASPELADYSQVDMRGLL